MLSLYPALLVAALTLGASPSADQELTHRARRVRFAVVPDRGPEGGEAAAYCEAVIRRTGVAVLARSRSSADYLLYPSMRVSSRVTYVDHKKTVEVESVDAAGKKTKKKEDRKTHTDEVATVSVRFACSIEPASADERPLPVVTIEGRIEHSTRGTETSGHGADDDPIRFRSHELTRLERDLGSPEGNSGQPSLYKALFDLCNVTGRVTAVDAAGKRLTVDLGSDDGIIADDDPRLVTEMEVFALTGSTGKYTFSDPTTGKLYLPDRKTVQTAPDNPKAWTFREDGVPQGAPGRIIMGEAAGRLEPLGEKIIPWAEVQAVSRTSCTVMPKRKGDFGRTVDDMKALAQVPDPATTIVTARVRVKGGFLQRSLSTAP